MAVKADIIGSFEKLKLKKHFAKVQMVKTLILIKYSSSFATSFLDCLIKDLIKEWYSIEKVSIQLIINDNTECQSRNINLMNYFYRIALMEIKYLDRGSLFNDA